MQNRYLLGAIAVGAMASEARRLAPELAWPHIASRYAALGEELLDNRAPLSANR